MKYDGLFFDMDGTLWDGVEAYAQGFNDYFELNDISRRVTRDDLCSYMGYEEEEYLAQTLPDLSPANRKKAYQKIIELQYQRIEKDGGILYEGVMQGLLTLSSQYKLFIVSNCPEFTIDYFMKWANISHLITDTMAHGMNYRPKHENISHIINKHEISAPIYIGDTASDQKQCKILDLPFGFVSYGFGIVEDAEIRFDTFTQLTNYFMEAAE